MKNYFGMAFMMVLVSYFTGIMLKNQENGLTI